MGIQVGAALTLDALNLIEKGIMGVMEEDPDVFRWIFRRGDVYNYNRTRGVPCTTRPPIPWMLGAKLLSKMKLVSPS